MKTISKLTVQAYLMILTLSACSQEPMPVVTPKEYESCCGTEPVEFRPIVNGKNQYIYIPNVFTPNKDGINDLFKPAVNDEIGHIEYIVITKEVEDNTTDPTLYDSGFIGEDRIDSIGWDGLDKEGKPYIGLFEYAFYIVTKEGEAYLIKSKACAIQCGPDAAIFKDKTSCFYESQANASGMLEIGKGHGEGDCFR